MAQKKKKGPAPKTKEPKKKRLTTGQLVIYTVGIIVILSMLISTIRYF